ncbi:Rha family transcriptional regulator [Serratia marcescens]|uniref:Rha family transcriptional regulator n=1 Tax=Serratia marcescens TaxID=615 RepID=UPI00148BA3E1|nr:Rha family transcriptional regulator [Serratia marcescens]QJU41328.1 Rha family transcriptional regulator [Serratia marcescens]
MATKSPALAPEIIVSHGQAVTTTRSVSDFFGKRHADVIRRVETIDCSPEFTERNFALSDYQDPTGRTLPMYQITKNGFVFLVMGFTGKKAAQFKEAYIAEFDRMENELASQRYGHNTLGDLTGTANLSALVDKLQQIIHEGEFIPAGKRPNYSLPANRKHEATIIRDFLSKDDSSTLLTLLEWLRADGFDVSAADRELDIIRGYVGGMRRALGDIQTHARYIDHAIGKM